MGHSWRRDDLAESVGRLADEIRRTTAGRRSVVSLECDRGLASVLGFLAVRHSDNVPLLGWAGDPADRRARLRRLSGARAVVSVSTTGKPMVFESVSSGSDAHPDTEYLVATSGTTGAPKVAPIRRAVFDAYLDAVRQAYRMTATDRVLQFAAPGFDVFVEEVMTAFESGAAVVMPPWQHAPAAGSFLDFVESSGVTVVNLPSSYWMAVADFMRTTGRPLPPSVRLVVIGSEPVSRRLVEWALSHTPGVRILNAYGVSEAAPTCLVFDCDELGSATSVPGVVPIGRPLDFVRFTIEPGAATSNGRLVLETRPGPEPLDLVAHDTGDVVEHGADGYLYLRGRADLARLKRGGSTVNAESLAAVARECVNVLEASAHVETATGALVLTVQSSRHPDEVAAAVRAKLQSLLPPAWQPDRVDVLSGTGRVPGVKMTTPLPGLEPASGCERIVRTVWLDRLGVPDVDEHTDFFDAGGDSIAAVRVCSLVGDAMSWRVPVQMIFANPRFGDFCRAIDTAILAEQLRPNSRPVD